MREKIRKIWGCLAALLVTIMVLGLAGCGDTQAGVSFATTGTETESDSGEASESKPESAESETESQTISEPEKTSTEESELTVEKNGSYTSKEEVALYIHIYGTLPDNFITKKEAEELGWKQKDGKAGQLDVVAPGMSIGGSYFGNYEGLLPEEKGRKYYECDINYTGGNRGAERIIYSNDGLVFYTGDHYKTFEQLYPEE